jgi:tetratricopeptide (TPR) repeat protein
MAGQPRLSAFIGRSFLPQDEALWMEVRTLLESFKPLDFAFEDAKEAQPLGVSDKVRAGIDRNDVYIGILSHRDLVVDQAAGIFGVLLSIVPSRKRWSPPPWVVQESGYALGVKKRVVLLIEEGVQFPTSNLDADREWISFRREAIQNIAPRLSALINHLIAERLPVVPAAVAPVSAPEAPAPTEKDDALASRESSSLFEDILELVEKDPSVETDRAFDERVRALEDGQFKLWVPYFFLSRKAIKGDKSSLEKLSATVNGEPGNVAARSNLASYHEHFDQPLEAARILLENLPAASPGGQARLMRQAAHALSKAQAHDRAIAVLGDLIKQQGGSAATFTSVADVAGAMLDRSLELAALERALVFEPGNSGLRFRLAFAYSAQNNYALGMYHYKVRLSQRPDPAALNNLGVAYESLKMPGKEIESYLKAAPENELAKANLSHAYLERGFLSTAEELAGAVLAAGQIESVERDRSASVLQQVTSKRGEETEKEENILRDARREADFRATFAEAHFDDGGAQLVPGLFGTPHGQLALRQDGDRLAGTATIREKAPQSLFASMVPGGATREQTRVLKLEGTVDHRAGSFTLSTEITPDGLLAIPERSEVECLFVIALDGRSLEVLEKGKEASKVYTAQLAPPITHSLSI